LETFDQPDTSVSCARRETTTVAPQALALLNSEFVHEQARRLAASAGSVEAAWRRALGRAPSAEEKRRAGEFVARGSLADLAVVLFNLNEFLYVD
ncbi:MAG: DUF1553 domain-containing protein, partial [Bryobacteraceae bacterium]